MRKQVLKGGKEIGEAINESPRATFHLLRKGRIKCAVKKGKTWYCHRDTLLCEFGKQQQHHVERQREDA